MLIVPAGFLQAQFPAGLPGIGGVSPMDESAPKKEDDKAKQDSKAKSDQKAPAAAEVSGGKVGEYVIKGESRLALDSEKPPLQATLDDGELIKPTLETEKQAFLVGPPDFGQVKDAVPTEIHSDFVIVPRYFEFRPDAVAHEFKLRAELDRIYKETNLKEAAVKARWEFRIADASGKIYMEFSGKGLPPDVLAVPTRNVEGEPVRPGSPYAGVLTYRDSYGEVHTALTSPFTLSGLLEKTEKGYVINLSLEALFERKPKPEDKDKGVVLSAAGKSMVQETADWIKSHRGALAPLYITVYSGNKEKGQKQADFLAGRLIQSLLRSKENVQARGSPSGSHLDEYVEIAVFVPKK